ncbi:hypothetical protein CDCA_CDCA05G1468 [Cyanidium caldarium]|uniref:SAM-dependent MTase RsmB/NOP-type domain-containing protein n=1 Tax=Cyanidium caldarium TaxID=2771 RepID=A0AAV9IUB8_CYACA|nr:hypothetical protein CDCA_CDCA05G1468 [Cyanidium caldarium]
MDLECCTTGSGAPGVASFRTRRGGRAGWMFVQLPWLGPCARNPAMRPSLVRAPALPWARPAARTPVRSARRPLWLTVSEPGPTDTVAPTATADEAPTSSYDRHKRSVNGVMSTMAAREAAFLAIEKTLLPEEEYRYEAGDGSGRHEVYYVWETLAEWNEMVRPSRADYALAMTTASHAVRQRRLFDYALRAMAVNDLDGHKTDAETRDARRTFRLERRKRALLHMALAQYAFLDRVPMYAIVNSTVELAKRHFDKRFGAFVNALLRNLEKYALHEAESGVMTRPAPYILRPLPFPLDSLSVRYSFPGAFVQRLSSQVNDEAQMERILLASNLSPVTQLRVPLTDVDAPLVQRALEMQVALWETPIPSEDAAAAAADATTTTPEPPPASLPWQMLRMRMSLSLGPESVEMSLPLTDAASSARQTARQLGERYPIQCAAQAELIGQQCRRLFERWPAQRLRRVVDLCAAPGGKLRALHDYVRSVLSAPQPMEYVALDVSPLRLKQMQSGAFRHADLTDISVNYVVGRAEHLADTDGNRYLSSQNASHTPRFDVVIADVPCTNTGVLSRRPEARWRLRKHNFKSALPKIIARQKAILERALHLARVAVLYSTCSVLREEGEDVVREVLAATPGFELVWQRLIYPDPDYRDGGYGALIMRTQPPEGA